MKCKECKYWYNRQRDLDYSGDYGICEFDIGLNEPDSYRVLLHPSIRMGLSDEYLNYDNTLKYYSYTFATHKDFGCIRGVKND